MKQVFLRWLVVLMLLPAFAQAQVTPMQRSVAGLIENKMAARGFASNDPRWAATLQSGGSAIVGAAGAAAAITAAGITAPAWVTAAATVALGSVLAYGINLAIDGIKWLINANGSVTYTSVVSPSPLVLGGPYWVGPYGCGKGSSAMAAASVSACVGTNTVTSCTENGNSATCAVNNGQYTINVSYMASGSPCSSSTGACDSSNNPVSAPATSQDVTKSPTEAVGVLTADQRAKAANPALIAKIADQAWKAAAAQPGYQGIPYDMANPITETDATAYRSANPANWPTVGDLVAPQVSTSGSAAGSPWSLPNSATDVVSAPSTSNQTPAITQPTFDWSIPNFGEQVAKQSVPVTYVPTVFAASTGCPAPITFSMFSKQYSISYGPFCDLMQTLAPIFLACGAAAAALIFASSLKS